VKNIRIFTNNQVCYDRVRLITVPTGRSMRSDQVSSDFSSINYLVYVLLNVILNFW